MHNIFFIKIKSENDRLSDAKHKSKKADLRQNGGPMGEEKSTKRTKLKIEGEMKGTRSIKSSRDSTRAQSRRFDETDDDDDDDASFPTKDRRRRSKRLRDKQRVNYRE